MRLWYVPTGDLAGVIDGPATVVSHCTVLIVQLVASEC